MTTWQRYVVEEQDAGLAGRYAVVDTANDRHDVVKRTMTKGDALAYAKGCNRYYAENAT